METSSYVYEIRVDGVVRYIGKGREGRMYSHMIEAKRTANKPGVKIANLSPHFRKMLVRAIRQGAKIKEKIITADLSNDAAYILERRTIGTFHKNYPGQLWNTIDERFMSSEYLPDNWSNPVHPLYKVPRPLTLVGTLNGENTPRFFGQVILKNAGRNAKLGDGEAATTEKTITTNAEANLSAPECRLVQNETMRNETMRKKVMRRSMTNPRLKLAKPSGKGLVIVGAKP
jgi:hypothetical protein